MFDEIFKRWINTGQLTEGDIVPLLLEWNQTFGNGKATADQAALVIRSLRIDYASLLQYILTMIGIKRGYEWAEIYDQRGRFIARFWQKNPN